MQQVEASHDDDVRWMEQVRSLEYGFDDQLWLELQCGLLSNVRAALVARRAKGERFVPAALWPAGRSADVELLDLVDQVLEQGCGLATPVAAGGCALGYPVRVRERLQAVICVRLERADAAQVSVAMRQLHWGASWLVQAQMQQHSGQEQALQHQQAMALQLMTQVLAEPDYEASALRLVTELAGMMHADLVALGEWQQGASRVSHLSHSAEFGRKMNLVRALERAMDEAVDQRTALQYPQPADDSAPAAVLWAHRELAELLDRASLMSLPLYRADLSEVIGCVCLQREAQAPFSAGELEFCESVLMLAAQVLWEKRQNAQPLYRRLGQSLRRQGERLLGPGHSMQKLCSAALVAVLLFCALARGEYRLSADATVEAALQRLIVAPYDGFIQEAAPRAGDRVAQGALLALLDDRDLQLERLNWLSQQNRMQRRYQEAMAAHDRAQINIINAQLDQARAELELLDSQIERAQLQAPFAGLVVSGDLSQRLGGAVTQGELLFTLAPEGAYRVALKVRESRIADLVPGQSGVLYLSALPDQPVPIRIDTITPLTLSESGASYFRVEALLDKTEVPLQVGMQGVGKILIDERRLISIWSRELVEWLRLSVWTWWG